MKIHNLIEYVNDKIIGENHLNKESNKKEVERRVAGERNNENFVIVKYKALRSRNKNEKNY